PTGIEVCYNLIKNRGRLNMKISIITVGKLKEKYLKQVIEEYVKRLRNYAMVEVIEVRDEKAPDTLSEAEMTAAKKTEGARLLAHVQPDMHVITLEINGKMLNSEQLASKMNELAIYGKSKVAFVIGGSLGLSEAVQKRSNLALSFS